MPLPKLFDSIDLPEAHQHNSLYQHTYARVKDCKEVNKSDLSIALYPSVTPSAVPRHEIVLSRYLLSPPTPPIAISSLRCLHVSFVEALHTLALHGYLFPHDF